MKSWHLTQVATSSHWNFTVVEDCMAHTEIQHPVSLASDRCLWQLISMAVQATQNVLDAIILLLLARRTKSHLACQFICKDWVPFSFWNSCNCRWQKQVWTTNSTMEVQDWEVHFEEWELVRKKTLFIGKRFWHRFRSCCWIRMQGFSVLELLPLEFSPWLADDTCLLTAAIRIIYFTLRMANTAEHTIVSFCWSNDYTGDSVLSLETVGNYE